MKRIFDEQITGKDSHTAAADILSGDDFKSISLEKFKDVTALIKAYNSLEAEFTKRSQRLRKLEGEYEALKAEAETKDNSSVYATTPYAEVTAKEFLEKYPCAEPYVKEIESARGLSPETSWESACIAVLAEALKKQADSAGSGITPDTIDSAIKDGIIRQFLAETSGANPKELLGGGEIVVTPPIKPKDLKEAKLLAEKFFR